ncbi:hypothetical protein ACHHYP_03253 [Achlya hypogyna]|uniref:Uncharacterized protein n=1 Tax=Achlya hypogyna TaxID=1202772 RepID=A0A1V9ZRE2_ACHHY|nr:hypothetical protein ACHHYP_03253 [Achlya hypogyna]
MTEAGGVQADPTQDKALLKSMVERSRRRLVSIAAGQSLDHVLEHINASGSTSPTRSSPNAYISSKSTSLAASYQVMLETDTLRGDKHIPRRHAMKEKEVHDARRLQHILERNEHRRNAGVAYEVVHSDPAGRHVRHKAAIEPVRTDDHAKRPAKQLFQKAMHKLQALGLNHDHHRSHGMHVNPHVWFQAMRDSLHPPPAKALGRAYAHGKFEPIGYGATVFLQTVAGRTCLLLDGTSGKSVSNPEPRDSQHPGTLFRVVDFTNPTRAGPVHGGDAIWLQLVGAQRPLHPSTGDVLDEFVNERQYYLARAVAPELDVSGPQHELLLVAGLLEVSVPRLSHYGYDASLGEHLKRCQPAMQMAQWNVQLSTTIVLDDPLGDDVVHRHQHPGSCLRNYSVVTLQLQAEPLVLEFHRHSQRAVIASVAACRSERGGAEWQLCLCDPSPALPLHKGGSSSNSTKAHVSLHQSRARAGEFTHLQSQLHRAWDHIQQTSHDHLATLSNAKEAAGAKYYADKSQYLTQ